MTMKDLSPKPKLPPLDLSLEDYRLVSNGLDEALLGEAFIGVWPSRDALGAELLNDVNAQGRLLELPAWLHPYVSIDREQFVADLEAGGMYLIREVRDGICVLDGQLMRAPPDISQPGYEGA